MTHMQRAQRILHRIDREIDRRLAEGRDIRPACKLWGRINRRFGHRIGA